MVYREIATKKLDLKQNIVTLPSVAQIRYLNYGVTLFLRIYKIIDRKMKKELEDRVQKAIDNFMQGYGCCQSVVTAFADLYGMDDNTAKKVAAGFGGGVARMRMMCGAVSGMVILAGLDCGQTEGADREGKSACYKVIQDLLAKFKERNSSIICADLLKLNKEDVAHSSYEASERTAEYYQRRPCVKKVESAAIIFAEYLEEKETKI